MSIIKALSKTCVTVALIVGLLVAMHCSFVQETFRSWTRHSEKAVKSECILSDSSFVGNFSFGNQITPDFMPGFKNPCWRPEGTRQILYCVPYVFLAGFPKCGTTDLFERLVKHHHVKRGRAKECHYLTRAVHSIGSKWCSKQQLHKAKTSCEIVTYANHCFSNFARDVSRSAIVSHPQITVDASASTAWDNTPWVRQSTARHCPEPVIAVPAFVRRINPKAKVIFILRDPVERTLSDYMYFGGKKTMEDLHNKTVDYISNFNTCLQKGKTIRACAYTLMNQYGHGRLSISIYHVYIQDWLDTFQRDQLYILKTEDYHSRIEYHLKEIFAFLDLADVNGVNITKIADQGRRANVNQNKKNVEMWAETRRLLQEFYRPHNAALAELLADPHMTWAYD